MKKIIISAGVILLVALAALVMLTKKPLISERPVVSESGYSKGDVNKDGKVSVLDTEMLRQNMDCDKTLPCWNETVGKTVDGDNPIYTSDLDLDGDGKIGAPDMTFAQ